LNLVSNLNCNTMLAMNKIVTAKWLNNTGSPVMFMIDDFCNKWIDLDGNGKVDLGEDWGHARDEQNSSFAFLKETFLDRYPDLKITFFTTVGVRSSFIKESHYNGYSAPINADGKTKEFYRSIYSNKRFEIAYHGLTHGIPGSTPKEFQQEWVSYHSLEEALIQIQKGKDIYRDTFGEYPRGGKYCGYEYNDYSDESISKAGFFWWCREWNRGMKNVPDSIRFEPKCFGDNKVIDIPSTISGDLLTIRRNTGIIKYFLKKALKPLWAKKQLKLIAELLKNRQIISIQEHVAPAREDGKAQVPNIFEDRDSLFCIFDFLKGRSVWYATGSEIAEYIDARENTAISSVGEDSFDLKYSGRLTAPLITLMICSQQPIYVTNSSGRSFFGRAIPKKKYMENLININAENGNYKIRKYE
jgi:hypothetical protein